MSNVSIIPELDETEASVTSLCKAIQRKTQSTELRKEYQTLCNQVTCGLNKIRAIAEMDDWFTNGALQQALDKLK